MIHAPLVFVLVIGNAAPLVYQLVQLGAGDPTEKLAQRDSPSHRFARGVMAALHGFVLGAVLTYQALTFTVGS